MPTYISLMKLTDQGLREIKAAPNHINEVVKTLDHMGGKLTNFYMVMGEYDYVAVVEAPNDEVASTFVLALGSRANVRTTTLKGFNREQFAGIIKNLA